jgi:hypothetical protein
VACLLALSGCSVSEGPLDTGSPDRTLTPAPVPSETATTGPTRTAVPTPVLRAIGGPGIDPWMVADAHAETLRGSSYTWTVAHERRTYHRGPPATTRTTRLTARVANGTTYRVDRAERAGTGPWSNATVAYADSSRRYTRTPGSNATVRWQPVERSRGGEGAVADRSEAVVARYLAAGEVSVIDYPGDEDRFLLRGRGAPPGATNVSGYRVGALIRSDGRVTALRAAWREPNGMVVVSYEFRNVGNTTVGPPVWATGGIEDAVAVDDRDTRSPTDTTGSAPVAWEWPTWTSMSAMKPRAETGGEDGYGS